MNIDINENLLNVSRKSENYDNEIDILFSTEEGQQIKADIDLLKNMGFEQKMINKVYILLRPENIERAIDYMTEIDGIYQHDFFQSGHQKEQNLCFICKMPRQNHLDFIPEDLLNDVQNNNNQFQNIPNHINNIDDGFIDDDIIEENDDKKNQTFSFDECEVCYESIFDEDKKLNSIPCGHLFCTHCWFNYLKTLILEAKVENIRCMDHECKEIMTEEFILNHIKGHQELILKYEKFKKRAEIIKDKNKKLCPHPDCDSFLQRSKSRYVKCENGHTYCFECLRPPHGKKKCEQDLEKQFMKWKKGKRVKRCPRCQIYTEKNEGCNHMTCVSCKYQWCWLCEEQYQYDHYKSGKCKGHQFTKADYIKDLTKYKNAFGIHKIFPFFSGIDRPFDLDGNIFLKYIYILLFWLFGYVFFFNFHTINYLDNHIQIIASINDFLIVISCFIGLILFISFQIVFTTILTPFILIALIYHKFFDRILMFFSIGEKSFDI